MHRIDTATRNVDEHGAGKDGFTNGTPGVTAATDLDHAWFDAVQEEIASFIEAQGITLVKNTNTQLRSAVIALIQAASINFLPDELQWTDTSEAAAIGDHIRTIAPEVATSERTLLLRHRIGAGVTEPRQLRLYLSGDGTSTPAFEFTVNAQWNGSQWVRDTASDAFLFRLGTSLRIAYRASGDASPWNDSSWDSRLTHAIASDALTLSTTNSVLNVGSINLSDVASSIDYLIGPSRTLHIAPWEFFVNLTDSGTMGSIDTSMQMGTNSMRVRAQPRLPNGAIITAVEASVDPGVARSGSDRMELQLRRQTWATPPVDSSIASAFDNATGAAQVISLSTGLPHTVDNATYRYEIKVFAGNTAEADPDFLDGVRITYTDPGPRNH